MRLRAEDWLSQASSPHVARLSQLFAPLPIERFLRSQWLRKPTVIRAASHNLPRAGLPVESDLWDMLRDIPELRRRSIAVREGKGAPNGLPSPPSFRSLRRVFEEQRTSLVLHQLEDASPKVRRLARALASVLRGKTFCNAYMTPESAWAFPIHWDCHEAIVVQLSGSKRWYLYDAIMADPLEEIHDSRRYRFRSGRPRLTVVLRQGDLLYIPRGIPHRAECQAERSTHITFGIAMPTAYDILREATLRALADLAEQPRARRVAATGLPLPEARAAQMRGSLRTVFDALARDTLRHLDASFAQPKGRKRRT